MERELGKKECREQKCGGGKMAVFVSIGCIPEIMNSSVAESKDAWDNGS